MALLHKYSYSPSSCHCNRKALGQPVIDSVHTCLAGVHRLLYFYASFLRAEMAGERAFIAIFDKL